MMKVLLFSRDPGGSNTIIPLIKPLQDKDYEVVVYGKDFALQKYKNNGVDSTDISTVISEINVGSLKKIINEENPIFVITGTSADDNTEKYIWKACCDLNVLSLAIIDQWCNYGLRFSNYGIGDLKKYQETKKHPWLPTRIATLDEFARQEMISQGLPEEIIVVCGQPYLEMLRKHIQRNNSFSSTQQDNIFRIIFSSEPISASLGLNKTLGYDEQSIFSALLRALESLAPEINHPIKLILRPHPKEKYDNLLNCLNKYPDLDWAIDIETPTWELVENADLICGMSSMFLIESLIMGKQVLSIQIGLAIEDPFILSRRDIVPSILSVEELTERLRAIIIKRQFIQPDFEFVSNSIDRIISTMENLICQN